MRTTSKHRMSNWPCLHFQVQDHSESVLHKNGQSNTCLSQVYAPRIAIIYHYISVRHVSNVCLCSEEREREREQWMFSWQWLLTSSIKRIESSELFPNSYFVSTNIRPCSEATRCNFKDNNVSYGQYEKAYWAILQFLSEKDQKKHQHR